MKYFNCLLMGLVLVSVYATEPESPNTNEVNPDCDCSDSESTNRCAECPDDHVCEFPSESVLERCNCTAKATTDQPNRAKRYAFFFTRPDKSVKCECKISASKDITFFHCPKDEDILSINDAEFLHPVHRVNLEGRVDPESDSGDVFTEEEFDRDDFRCKPKKSFQLACNTCWCKASGEGAKYCTRIACKTRNFPRVNA